MISEKLIADNYSISDKVMYVFPVKVYWIRNEEIGWILEINEKVHIKMMIDKRTVLYFTPEK